MSVATPVEAALRECTDAYLTQLYGVLRPLTVALEGQRGPQLLTAALCRSIERELLRRSPVPAGVDA